MNRYDEARSLTDLATEKLKETTPTEETASNLQEAINALHELGAVLDSEEPAKDEVETSRPLDPRNDSGVLIARGKAEVESLVLNPGAQVLVRVAAPASTGDKPAPTLTIGTISLERLGAAAPLTPLRLPAPLEPHPGAQRFGLAHSADPQWFARRRAPPGLAWSLRSRRIRSLG